ncbi:hypothetical protein PUNSTDRAFT_144020 [Punctularia strigosozonata HHB-11173 SS5]|uniref:uncharacterized protein n=1 Tax=Punctularia strigosozonata (strain HHB-11173) TaxID=741275 RepID=UPI0004417297|nr:uncharacterized protein PUNSTDRAFT_144020 [Punctularia strigosozonata HHB-11173 SS5]EIN08421.1 hypothetical protein PUNSTDRAFT_144020 [Punctularia strigosozonata HHB-11173 SS5]
MSRDKLVEKKSALDALVSCVKPGGLLLLGDGGGSIFDEHKKPIPPAGGDAPSSQYSWLSRYLLTIVSNIGDGNSDIEPEKHYLLRTVKTMLQDTMLFSEVGYCEFFAPIGWDGNGMENGHELGEIMRSNHMALLDMRRPLLVKYGFPEEQVEHWAAEARKEMDDPSKRRYARWISLWAFRSRCEDQVDTYVLRDASNDWERLTLRSGWTWSFRSDQDADSFLMDVENNPETIPRRPGKRPATEADDEPSSKKTKVDGADVKPAQPPRRPFDTLPLELLAEILSYTSSPRDILAVARCSKVLCDTLVQNPATVYIWRKARARAQPEPIPDPTPNFHEAAYAAFIYDPGICYVCGAFTKKMYESFSLRVRLCNSAKCIHKYRDQYLMSVYMAEPYLEWLLAAECHPSALSASQYWPDTRKRYLRSQHDEARDYYNKAQLSPNKEELLKAKSVVASRISRIMTHAVSLVKWSEKWQKKYDSAKGALGALRDLFAAREGWNQWDLHNSETYGALERSRMVTFETISEFDFATLKQAIQADMTKISERRERQKAEELRRKRRNEIAKFHQRIQSQGERNMPSLSEFRKLPAVSALQGNPSINLKATLKQDDDPIAAVMGDIQKWRDALRATLAARLGYPEYQSTSQNVLHPVDRVTARFVCTVCRTTSRKYDADGCLDFAGVCGHECRGLDEKKRKHQWNADNFIPQRQVIDVIAQAYSLLGLKPDDPECKAQLSGIGARIRCLSCKAVILMDFQSMIGHSGRHETMEITIISREEADLVLTQPLELGLTQRLFTPSIGAKKEHRHKVYGCRHCIQHPAPSTSPDVNIASDAPGGTVLLASNGDAGSSAGSTERVTSAPRVAKSRPVAASNVRLWDLNALRSHVKAKHGVALPRDEDVFRVVV